MKVDKDKVALFMANSCLTSRDVAREAELKESVVSRITNGYDVRPATIGRFAKALRVNVEEILYKGN